MTTPDSMYQQVILDHYRDPHHRGLREPFDVEVHHVNPTCGDEVTLRVAVQDGVVSDVSYEGEGCSISQASTSVMTDLVIGRPVGEALEVEAAFLALMGGRGTVEPDEDVLEDGVAFAGVARYPARVKCALLGWTAWKDATAQAVAGGTATAQAVAGGTATAQAVAGGTATAQAVAASATGTAPQRAGSIQAATSDEGAA